MADTLTVTFSLTAGDPDGEIKSWKLDIDNDGVAEYFGSGKPPSTKQHTYEKARYPIYHQFPLFPCLLSHLVTHHSVLPST